MANQTENGNGHHAYNPFMDAVPMVWCRSCDKPHVLAECSANADGPGLENIPTEEELETRREQERAKPPHFCRDCGDRLLPEEEGRTWRCDSCQEDVMFPASAELVQGFVQVPGATLTKGGGTVAPSLRVLDTHRLLTTTPPPLDWLAEGIYARGKLTLFGGREKSGKSLIQLALAARMASGGGELAGIPVQPAKVLIIDAENGEEEVHRRLRCIGLEPEHAENLVVVEARGVDLRYDLDHVEKLIDEREPDLVLLDSFRALWRGDERDEAEIAKALYPVADLTHDRKIAAGMTHHALKGDGNEYRGSTTIGACVEWIVMLSRDREDPMKTRRRLSNPYGRFAAQRDDRWLTIASFGDDAPISVEEAEVYVPEREAPVRDAIETELREFIESKVPGATSPKGDGTVAPCWTTADLARAVGRGAKDGTVRRALDRLADAGVLQRAENGKWSPSPTLFDDGPKVALDEPVMLADLKRMDDNGA